LPFGQRIEKQSDPREYGADQHGRGHQHALAGRERVEAREQAGGVRG
jgi:hypothetical protein